MTTLTILELNPQKIPQFGAVRRNGAKPSGVVVVHTAENTADLIGIDTGAENVAQFILTRDEYGSYHDIVDADSILHMVPYVGEAWGAPAVNNHAYHVSAAVEEKNWSNYPLTRKINIVENMAMAAAWYAEWLEEKYGIIIPAKRITPEEAVKGIPGFVPHAALDPTRRTDPGKDFLWDIFLGSFARIRGIDVENSNPTSPGTGVVVRPPSTETPIITEIKAPESYLPLKLDGDHGTYTTIELLRALKSAGVYSGLVKERMDTDGWAAYQRFLAKTEAYKGDIDGDFGQVSVTAEQAFLTAINLYNTRIDAIRGEETIRALQAALNGKQIKSSPVRVEITVSGSGWVNPVVGRLTSRYGPRGGGYHYGDDIAPPVAGTRGIMVVALASGQVVKTGYSSVLSGHTGNGVLIDHGGGLESYYGHLASIKVRAGQKVKVGDVIGEMGTSGNSTGIHLHLGVLVKKRFVPPYSWLKSRGVILGASTTTPTGGLIVRPKTPIADVTSSVVVREYDRQVQTILKNLGYYSGAIDGINGPQQKAAVGSYQRNQKYFPGLIVDQMWGEKTYAHYGWARDLQTAMNGWRGNDIAVDGDFGRASVGRVYEIMKANKGGAYRGVVDGVPGPVFCAMVGVRKHPNV